MTQAEYNRQYYEKNKEKILKRKKAQRSQAQKRPSQLKIFECEFEKKSQISGQVRTNKVDQQAEETSNQAEKDQLSFNLTQSNNTNPQEENSSKDWKEKMGEVLQFTKAKREAVTEKISDARKTIGKKPKMLIFLGLLIMLVFINDETAFYLMNDKNTISIPFISGNFEKFVALAKSLTITGIGATVSMFLAQAIKRKQEKQKNLYIVTLILLCIYSICTVSVGSYKHQVFNDQQKETERIEKYTNAVNERLNSEYDQKMKMIINPLKESKKAVNSKIRHNENRISEIEKENSELEQENIVFTERYNKSLKDVRENKRKYPDWTSHANRRNNRDYIKKNKELISNIELENKKILNEISAINNKIVQKSEKISSDIQKKKNTIPLPELKEKSFLDNLSFSLVLLILFRVIAILGKFSIFYKISEQTQE